MQTLPTYIYGQLVKADGTLYGSPILIAIGGLDPQVAFDSSNTQFLVVWQDSRNGISNIYGQLVNVEGSLVGNNFPVSPIPPNYYHVAGAPAVQFDSINNKFLVVWVGPSVNYPYNVYGQLVNGDGSLYGLPGLPIQITNYSGYYYAAFPDVAFDQNNSRFLVTWDNQNDGYIYGRLVNTNGTLHGSEISIGYYGLGNSYVASLSFDPVNSRFLQLWTGMKGQLINANGTLYGSEISIFNPSTHLVDNPSVASDTPNNKFLVTGAIQEP